MPEFIVKARTTAGHVIHEVVTADSKSAALKYSLQKKYIVTELTEKKTNILNEDLFEKWGKIKTKVFLNFIKEFSFLLKSGIPLYQSFEILAEQIKDKRLKRQIISIQKHLTEGMRLSQALQKFPRTFSPLFINMMKVGEKGGNIAEALDNIKEYVEREHAIQSKIKSAMTYPVIVAIVSVIVLTIMFTFVLPRFIEIFSEIGVELPTMTQVLSRVSNFVIRHIKKFIFFTTASIIGIKLAKYWPRGRYVIDEIKFKIPVVGKMVQTFMLVRVTRTMGTLLSTGVPLLETLTITRDVTENVVIEEQMNRVIEEVRDGKRLSKAMANITLFPGFILETVAVGESSGLIHEVLLDVAAHYDFELEESATRLSSIIEPLMLLLIGGVVLIIAMAVIVPMFNIVGNFRHGSM